MTEAPHTTEVIEMALCAGLDLARHAHECAAREAYFEEADIAAADLVLAAFDDPGNTAAPHTADIVQMVRDEDLAAALSYHESYCTAELERADLADDEPNVLDLWLAGAVLEAAGWASSQHLELVA